MADTISRPASTGKKAAAAGAAPATKRRGAQRKSPRRKPGHAPGDDLKPRPTALVGIAMAVWTAALGLAVLVCLTLAAWVTATHHDDAIRPAIATAVQAWLLAQHTSIGLAGGGALTLMPLGLTILLGLMLVRAGRLTARFSGAHDVVDTATSVLALALPYAVLAALLTNPARDAGSRPSPLAALVGAFVLAVVCGAYGAFKETDHVDRLLGRVRGDVRLVIRAGWTSSVIVLGLAATALTFALAAHATRAGELASSTHGGYSGVALTAVISMAYAPNAVAWTAAYAVGPGFAVGTHTSVTLTGAHLGGVPAFPLLAPLPDSAATAGWLLIAVPLVGGIVAGRLLARRQPPVTPSDAAASWWRRGGFAPAAWGLAAGAAAGVVLAVVAALSAGAFGPGRMSDLGPSAWWVLIFAAAEIGVVAAATIWLHGWTALRREAHVVRLDQEISLP